MSKHLLFRHPTHTGRRPAYTGTIPAVLVCRGVDIHESTRRSPHKEVEVRAWGVATLRCAAA
eukprot:1358965-Amorphochlora_amoeboformis.AAC.1